MEEKEEQLKMISYVKGTRKPGSINITDVSAKWATQTVLHDLNLKIRPGSLCCIFGPPCSGKTSFLHLLLKEVIPHSGRVEVIGTISYASQKPWLFQSTIKSNILFGLPYNRHKYREIIRICGLDTEFQKLPCGDRSLTTDGKVLKNCIVKEKINIARTIYRDADIYIFDDCFDSIDTETGKFIFSECFNKYLKGKTRIFVSRKLYFAREANTIVVLDNGTICRKIDGEDLTEAHFQYLNSKVNIEKDNFSSPDLKQFIQEIELNSYENEQDVVTRTEAKRRCCITLLEFLKISGKKYIVKLLFLIIVLNQITANISDFWLLQWVNQSNNGSYLNQVEKNYVQYNISSIFRILYHKFLHDIVHEIPSDKQNISLNVENQVLENTDKDFYICFYAGFICICIILTAIKTILFHTLCMKASRALHAEMFEKVLYSPMKFFETYPSGIILQRFSKDMDVINDLLPKIFITLQMSAAVFGTLLLILYTLPIMILPVVLLMVMVYFLASRFVTTIRSLQRLENNTQAPIHSFLVTSFYGVFNIRSAEAEKLITEVFENLLDQHSGVWSLILMTNEYICFYLDFVMILFLAIITFSMISIGLDNFNSGYIGLAMTHSIILTELLHVGIRENIEVLGKLSTVERNLSYTRLMKEDVNKATLIPKNWPYCGKIVFKHVYIKDNDGYGSFLKNLNIVIKPSEKIAIVSRYPEEKRTLVNCLFRLVKVEGLVTIDEVDTSQISLNRLRSTITIITQEPVLFSSSVRFNLDPLDNANDEMLWKVLEDVGMKTSIQSLSQPIIDGGFNFSSGQRQLLCLARAILRNTKIMIIESNMDPNIQNLMKKIIHENLKNCTVITIANKLSTVMDTDKILVLDEGKEVEYAHAHELFQNKDGYLSKIVKESEPTMEETLRNLAKDNFDLRNLEIEFKFTS